MEHTFQELLGLIGRERSLAEVAEDLYVGARRLEPAAVGAALVTCADESEHECDDAFQVGFVQPLLPPLPETRPSPFRLANLGGRYEPGAIQVAEQHFALAESKAPRFKLMVVKLNAHVAYERTAPFDAIDPLPDPPPFRFGGWMRYALDSPGCGALAATLGGATQPFARELGESFRSGEKDRLATLMDPKRVRPVFRPLFAALVSARLQARFAAEDIRAYRPLTPTCWLVVPCVTINRSGPDTEIVCGVGTLDGRGDALVETYRGLGDDPARYVPGYRDGRFEIAEREG